MSGHAAFAYVLVVLFLIALWLRSRGPPLLGARNVPQDTSLGAAGQGIHEAHVFDVAVFDFVGTVAGAAALAWVSKGSLVPWLVVLLIIGEVMHWAYGIPTATYTWLWGAS